MARTERGRDIVVIGGSAGSLEALRKLVAALPANLPAAILVVIHIPNDFPSYLQQILRDSGSLRTIEPREKQKLERGTIYVAPPDRHLLVEDGYVEVSRGPRENRHRPAIDPLFRSAARWHGRRVIGVVLSGQLDDGSSGLMAVKIAEGLTVVQDTREALCPEMPSRAKQYAGAEYELPVAKIADLLVEATSNQGASAVEAENDMQDELRTEAGKAKLESQANKEKTGKPSAFACPECHGVMWETEEGKLLRFRCRVGHAYTAEALRTALSDSVEEALWAAMRTLEEKAGLLRRIGARAGERQAVSYNEEAGGYDKHAETIRELLVQNQRVQMREESKAGNA
jgi:two-component system chemotaxis response regulator CheB